MGDCSWTSGCVWDPGRGNGRVNSFDCVRAGLREEVEADVGENGIGSCGVDRDRMIIVKESLRRKATNPKAENNQIRCQSAMTF